MHCHPPCAEHRAPSRSYAAKYTRSRVSGWRSIRPWNILPTFFLWGPHFSPFLKECGVRTNTAHYQGIKWMKTIQRRWWYQRLTQLNEAVSFHWTKQGFINVGINITANPVTKMFPANYRKLVNQTKNDLTHRKILPLSLFVSVEMVKIKVPPRLLCLFPPWPVALPLRSSTCVIN